MLKLKNNVDEILFLKKRIKYELSHKGGTLNTELFINNILNKHKSFSVISFYISIVIIFYIVLNNNIFYLKKSKNSLIGGALNNTKFENFENLLGLQNNYEDTFKDISLTLKPKKLKNLSLIKRISNTISTIYNTLINFLILNAASGFLLISFFLFLVILIIILILDYNIWVPCGGCQKDTKYIKCLPGTGVGSITCDILTEIKEVLSNIADVFIDIKKQIKKILKFIKKALIIVQKTILMINNQLLKILGFPLGILKSFFMFLKYIDIPDEWGFNLGELLIGGKTKKAIYEDNGKLKKEHGSNDFFKLFFKVIRILIEKPKMPKLTWPSFGGEYKPTIIKNENRNPNKQTPEYPIKSATSFNEKNNVYKKPIIKNPSIKDINSYNLPIDDNSIKSLEENIQIEKKNIDIEKNKQLKLKQKQERTQEFIKKTRNVLNKLKTKKEKLNFIKKQIVLKQKKIEELDSNNKDIIKLINTDLRPTFINIAKIGISPNIEKNEPAPKLKLNNYKYELINLKYSDLDNYQKETFDRLNNSMTTVNNNNINLETLKNELLELFKTLEFENNKIGDYKNDIKDYLYIKFLEILIQIDINPLKWLAFLFNNIIKLLNTLIEVSIINPSIAIVKSVFKIAKNVFDALIGELEKVAKHLLVPIYKMIESFKPILRVFYKVSETIKKFGPFNMIFYYFYDKIQSIFGFIGNIFVLLFITILVISILFLCPIIGGFYEIVLILKMLVSFIIMIIKDVILSVLYKILIYFITLVPTLLNNYKNILNIGLSFITGSIYGPIILIGVIIIIIFSYLFFSSLNNISFISNFILGNTDKLYKKIYNQYHNNNKDDNNKDDNKDDNNK